MANRDLTKEEVQKIIEDHAFEEDRERENMLYDFVKKNHYIPKAREIEKMYGFVVTNYFKDYDAMLNSVAKHHPDFETLYLNESINTDAYRKSIKEDIKKGKKFIITSAVCGKPVDEAFYNSLVNYAKRNKATVLVFPIINRNKKSMYKWDLDPKLREFKILFEEYQLNENLRLWDIKISATQVQSLTGLDRAVAPLNASIIVGSTKQSMKYIPTSRMKVPHMLASTGCCTVNDYSTVDLMPNRATKLAEVTHKLGGIVIEISSNKVFHSRNIEAGPSGEIVDFGKLYKPDGSMEKVQNIAMVVGDLHVPKHNEPLVDKHIQLIKKLGITTVVLHDTVNMGCVSHHNINKRCLKAIQAMTGENTIMGEAIALKGVMEKFSKATERVVVPFSNHPDHLNKYLEEARFVDDYPNFYVSLDLAKAYMDEKNVLQFLMEEKVGLRAENIYWLNEDDSCKVYKVEVGIHGSQRINGGKGSPLGLSRGVGKMVMGHTHSPSINENAYVVGMACEKDQGYNRDSLSSWLATSALIYPNGTVQLVNFVDVDGDYKYCI